MNQGRFRRKSKVIEAFKFEARLLSKSDVTIAVPGWILVAAAYGKIIKEPKSGKWEIATLNGLKVIHNGDYITHSEEGYLDVMNPEQFESQYEPA
jgi:hypothetical protein